MAFQRHCKAAIVVHVHMERIGFVDVSVVVDFISVFRKCVISLKHVSFKQTNLSWSSLFSRSLDLVQYINFYHTCDF